MIHRFVGLEEGNKLYIEHFSLNSIFWLPGRNKNRFLTCRFAQERPRLLTAEYFDAIEWFDETRETPDTELAELPPFLRLKSPPRTPFFFAFGVSKCAALYYVTKMSSKRCHQR